MILPGIKKELLSSLSKEDAKLVHEHIKLVKKVIQKKKEIIEGKTPEIFDIGKPRDEFEKLMKIIKEVESKENPDLISNLLDLEANLKDILKSIEEEYQKLLAIEHTSGENFKRIQKDIENELVLGLLIEHQLNLLYRIQLICRKTLKILKKFKGKKEEIGTVIENLDSIAAYIKTIIFTDEVPNLSVAYNILRLEGWPEIEERIQSLNMKFEELEPKQP